MNINNRGILLVISGPAGTGKGTVVKKMISKRDDIALSVSATTRSPRKGEIDGVHYHFISFDKFKEMIDNSMLLEYNYYCGNYYGTPKEDVENYLSDGKSVILEIDIHGGLNIKKIYPDAVLIMLLPPDFKTLESRIRGRNANTEDDIQNRLKIARQEIKKIADYDYVVFNQQEKCDVAANEILNIIDSEKHRCSRNKNLLELLND